MPSLARQTLKRDVMSPVASDSLVAASFYNAPRKGELLGFQDVRMRTSKSRPAGIGRSSAVSASTADARRAERHESRCERHVVATRSSRAL